MKMLSAFFFLLVSASLFSQNFSEKWVHGYLDFGHEERTFSNHVSSGLIFTNERAEFGFRNISLGMSKVRENGVYHEISLTRLQYEVEDDAIEITIPPTMQPVDGERTTTAGIGAQVETGISTSKWLAGFFRPAIGLGAVPELSYFYFTPKVSSRFPYQNFSVVLGLNVVPRLHFRISDRVALMAVFPIRVGTVDFQFEKTENPALPKEQQTVNTMNFEINPYLHLARLGTAIKL